MIVTQCGPGASFCGVVEEGTPFVYLILSADFLLFFFLFEKNVWHVGWGKNNETKYLSEATDVIEECQRQILKR